MSCSRSARRVAVTTISSRAVPPEAASPSAPRAVVNTANCARPLATPTARPDIGIDHPHPQRLDGMEHLSVPRRTNSDLSQAKHQANQDTNDEFLTIRLN